MAGRRATELVGSLLSVAAHPKGNPRQLDSPRYTLPLLAHDYPALTPVMWNACYRRFGLPVRNVAMVCRGADLGRIFDVLRDDPGYAGGGIGVGLKEEATRHLDDIDPLAEAIGAVNVVRRTGEGRLMGHSTDGDGFLGSLEEIRGSGGGDLTGLEVIVLGAGGTGRAIALALARRGAQIVVLNRTPERAARLATQVNAFFGRPACRAGGEERLPYEAPRADIIVNASTKGATGPLERYSALAEAPVPATAESVEQNRAASRSLLASLPRSTIVSDVVLGRGPTPTLALAREVGLKTLDGVGMVVHQGVEAFFLVHEEELREKRITRRAVAAAMEEAARASS